MPIVFQEAGWGRIEDKDEMDVDYVANKPLIEQTAKNNSSSLSSSTGTTRPHSDVQERTTKVIHPHSRSQESYASNNTVHAFTAPSLSQEVYEAYLQRLLSLL